MRDECHDIILQQDGSAADIGGIKVTKNGAFWTESTEAAPFTYDLWQQQNLDINKIEYANLNTPTVALAHNKCVVDYEITDSN